jgi:16S rRNA (guanine527-N7)-methyltransferase
VPTDHDHPLRARLLAGLQALDLSPGARACDQLLGLVDQVAGWAGRMNLSAHRAPGEILDHLVLEALALERQLPAAARIADLGSGAGFPGLPIAIVRPETQVLLVEARQKRHHFQRAAIRGLAIGNATPLLGRSESLEPRPAEGVVAQAMAEPHRVIEWMLPWTSPGGWLALPMSSQPIEITTNLVSAPMLRSYRVPPANRLRHVWLARNRS